MKQKNKPDSLKMDEKITNFLASLGYIVSEYIIIKKYISHRKVAQNKFLENFQPLHDSLIPHFNHRQITKILSRNGGYNNIEALGQHMPDLQKIGLTNEHIVKIAANNGGSMNIKAIVTHFSTLQKFGFTIDQIIKIASHCGGSKNITAVIESFIELKKLKYNSDDITKIVGHNGGSKNITAVIESFIELKKLKYNPNDIIKIVGRNGGSKNLYTIVNNHIMGADTDNEFYLLDECWVQTIKELEKIFLSEDKIEINSPILLFSASPIRVESPIVSTEMDLDLTRMPTKKIRINEY